MMESSLFGARAGVSQLSRCIVPRSPEEAIPPNPTPNIPAAYITKLSLHYHSPFWKGLDFSNSYTRTGRTGGA